MNNNIDYTSFLNTAIQSSGKDLDTIMKELAAAANKYKGIEKREAAVKNYDAPLDVEGSAFIRRIGTAEKIDPIDMAAILAHFYCQWVPGYSKYLVENDVDFIWLLKDSLGTNIEFYRSALKLKEDIRGKSAGEVMKAMENFAVDMIKSALQPTKSATSNTTATTNNS